VELTIDCGIDTKSFFDTALISSIAPPTAFLLLFRAMCDLTAKTRVKIHWALPFSQIQDIILRKMSGRNACIGADCTFHDLCLHNQSGPILLRFSLPWSELRRCAENPCQAQRPQRVVAELCGSGATVVCTTSYIATEAPTPTHHASVAISRIQMSLTSNPFSILLITILSIIFT
jgi:hypothetical protein